MPTVEIEAQADAYGYQRGGTTALVSTAGPELITGFRRASGINTWYQTLLRFAVSLPQDADISSASLRLKVVPSSPASPTNIALRGYKSDFGTTLDASDAAIPSAGTDMVGKTLAQATALADSWYEFPLTSLSAIPTSGNLDLSLTIYPYGTQYTVDVWIKFTFGSIEAGSAPVLVIGYGETEQQPASQPEQGSSPKPVILGLGGTPAARVVPRASIPWRIMLCDEQGRAIQNLTPIARERRLSFRLLRPASLSAVVPSDDPRVSGAAADGYPYLAPLRRTIRAYRREVLLGGEEIWRLRFSGILWQLEDSGDETEARTSFTAYDPLQLLIRRFTDSGVELRDTDGGTIVRTLIEQANARGRTGIATHGSVIETTPTRTVTYDRASVGEEIVKLAGAFNGFDILFLPTDEEGYLVRLHVFARLGQYQPEAVFAWGVPPHNVRSVRRLLDGETVATALTALGEGGLVSQPPAMPDVGLRTEAVVSHGVTNQGYLDALAREELVFRSRPREVVEIVPQPGRAPEPWTHVYLGDTVRVYAGERLRGGFAGVQRIYGFDLALDDNAIERVERFIAMPE